MSTYDCTVFQLHEAAFWENFIKDALDDTVRVGSVSVRIDQLDNTPALNSDLLCVALKLRLIWKPL